MRGLSCRPIALALLGILVLLESGCSTSGFPDKGRNSGAVPPAPEAPSSLPSSAVSLPSLPAPTPTRTIGINSRKRCTWVESSSAMVGGEDTTPRSLRLKAVSRAEEKALISFSGVSLTENTLAEQSSFDGQKISKEGHYVEDMLMAEHRGLLVDERILSSGYAPLPSSAGCPGCTRVTVILEACLRPLPPDSSRFQVHLALNQSWYREGDAATLTIVSPREGYLYLFDEDPLTHIFSVIAPNPSFLPVWKVDPDKKTVFPGRQLQEEGVELVAKLPPGEDFSSEILRVIVSRDPLPKEVWTSGEGKSFFGVIDWLLSGGIPWGEDAQAFTILGSGKKNTKVPLKLLEKSP